MEHFNYLLVIIGIVLGLGITHILSGFVDYLQNRDAIVWSRCQLVWMALLFLMQVQYWYVMFGVGQVGQDFSRYLAAIVFPTCLYLATGVLVPKVPADSRAGKFDLRLKYEVNRRWFFGFCILGMLSLVFYDHLVLCRTWDCVDQTLAQSDTQFRLGGLGLLVLLFLVGGWFHGLLTFLAIVLLIAFLGGQTLGWL